MKRILVPVDGSEFAEGALGPALALAARDGAELHLISVVSNAPPVPMAFADETLVSGWIEEAEAKAQTYLERAQEDVSSNAPEVAVTTHIRVGRVSRTIQEIAEELEADLLVLTTHGRGAFQRTWLGSIADQLLRRIEKPLLLLPKPQLAGSPIDVASIRHVLVPLDGSEAAESALDALFELLPGSGGVRVTVACVVEEDVLIPSVYLPHEISAKSLMEEHRARAEAYLEGVAERVRSLGYRPVEARVLDADDAAEGLLRFCEETGVQLIALSTHGRGGISRFLLGSVAGRLVRGSRVPVLVSRRPADERE